MKFDLSNFSNFSPFGSIKSKIAIWSGACLLLTCAVIIINSSLNLRSMGLDSATEEVGTAAREQATRARLRIEASLQTVRTVAQTLSAKKDEEILLDFSRDEINGILRILLSRNPTFIGVFTLWKEQALDNLDSGYIGAPGNDDKGRFMPYWYRGDRGQIEVETLVAHAEVINDYYNQLKDKKKELLTEPRLHTIRGNQVLITSLIVPIISQGNFYGLVGIDLDLDFLQTLADKADIYGNSGELRFLSSEGIILGAKGNRGLVGGTPHDWKVKLKSVSAGEDSKQLEDGFLYSFVSIPLGETSKTWSAVVRLPFERISEASTWAMWKQIWLGTFCVAAALVLLWFLAGGISRPIFATTYLLKNIAEGDGDLTKRLQVETTDESGQLAIWFNTFVDKIRGIILEVDASAAQLATSASSIAAASEEMSASIHEVASQAKDAAQNAVDAGITAMEGGKVISQTIEGIHEINQAVTNSSASVKELVERSQKIMDIIDIINDIAEKTNLLALNAAIEAARAGEIGKGFGVVAEHVRRLSEGTNQAADEIRKRLEDIQGETIQAVELMGIGSKLAQSGVESATAASGSLKKIVVGSSQVRDMVQAISSGMIQIREGVNQATDSAAELANMSEELKSIVGKFKLYQEEV